VVVVAEGAKFSADTDPQHGALIVTELSKMNSGMPGSADRYGTGKKKSNGIPDLKRARWYWAYPAWRFTHRLGPYAGNTLCMGAADAVHAGKYGEMVALKGTDSSPFRLKTPYCEHALWDRT